MSFILNFKALFRASSLALALAISFFTLIISFPSFSHAQDIGLLGPVDEFTADELAVFRSTKQSTGNPAGGASTTASSASSGGSATTTTSGSSTLSSAPSAPTVDDEDIRCAAWQLITLFEGNFGALIMIAAGIGAVIGSAMGMFRTASSLMVVAVSGFLLRGMVLIFFDLGEPSDECKPKLELPGAAIEPVGGGFK